MDSVFYIMSLMSSRWKRSERGHRSSHSSGLSFSRSQMLCSACEYQPHPASLGEHAGRFQGLASFAPVQAEAEKHHRTRPHHIE